MKRLGRNTTRYSGETVDINTVVGDCVAAARAHGWAVEEIHPTPRPIFAFKLNLASGPQPAPRIYISTGMHGDEPAGPLAARQLLQANAWPPGVSIWLCPCLNPTGFARNRRENAEGVDLNRDYREPKAAETVAHVAWLNRQPSFDVCLCLHEDWEAHGFYLYEQNPDDRASLAGAMIAQVAKVCPIDRSDTIEGRPSQNGIIRPNLDPRLRPQWPEAFFLLTHKTRLTYTLEAPSDFPLPARVAALVACVNAGLAATLNPVRPQ